MPENFNFKSYTGMQVYTMRYSKDEIKNAWNREGQGHRQAMERNQKFCLIKPCSEEEALIYSAIFLRHFNILTCTHYNGYDISLYCGDAGGDYLGLMRRVRAAIFMHDNYGTDEHGPLFSQT